jgi:uncharacterized membrane protein
MERFDVDRCLAELEAEDNRQKETLRKYCEREGMFLSGREFGKFILSTVFWFVVVFLIIAGFLAL